MQDAGCRMTAQMTKPEDNKTKKQIMNPSKGGQAQRRPSTGSGSIDKGRREKKRKAKKLETRNWKKKPETGNLKLGKDGNHAGGRQVSRES